MGNNIEKRVNDKIYVHALFIHVEHILEKEKT